ncbi:dihydrofolate reductase-like domain-containing protein, partial [Lipomyces japonicus]|uniref:dihydrofolate reductase-like domain-containing protein n=1 Tax=Lipomyces japonicus TaxID=56871 RepID=UPI0034CEEE94
MPPPLLEPLPPHIMSFLDPYLPPSATARTHAPDAKLFVTLTYAQSLDSRIALGKGLRTHLSGPQSKAMTHYLRSRHDAILVGVGTAVADDPALNCRYPVRDGRTVLQASPRPVIVDPNLRSGVNASSKVVRNAKNYEGKPAWLICSSCRANQSSDGIEIITVPGLDLQSRYRSWQQIFNTLIDRGIRSVMVEGGAQVINDLLVLASQDKKNDRDREFVSSLIITIAPTFLGKAGVEVSPAVPVQDVVNDVSYQQLGNDVVLAAKI